MRWASALETGSDTLEAVIEAARRVEVSMQGAKVDLLVVFVTAEHAENYALVPALLLQRFPGAALIGCSASAIASGPRLHEEGPGISLTAAHLPDTDVHTFHCEPGTEGLSQEQWIEVVGVDPLAQPSILLIPEPFETATGPLLAELDSAFPHSNKLGGVASGGRQPSDVALFADGFVHRTGVVGVSLVGDLAMDTVVAQGARMVGPTLTITGAHGNEITSLDGEPVLEVLQKVYGGLSAADQALFQRQPMVGLSPDKSPLLGDYLVRAVVGVRRADGVMAIASAVTVGQPLRFHVRDARSAQEELRELLKQKRRPGGYAGALVFSCLGRGSAFFGSVDHDARAVQAGIGPVPAGGFMANGEIGPVKGATHMHGYTASIGLFRPAGWN